MLENILRNKYLLLIMRLVAGFVFLYAAIAKVSDPEGFAQAISNYKLLPVFLVNLCAITLPWIELSAGLFLIFGISIKENSAILAGLLIIFIIAIVISLLRGLDIQCGCFGTVEGSRVGITKVLENIGLLLLVLLLMKFDSEFLSLYKKDK